MTLFLFLPRFLISRLRRDSLNEKDAVLKEMEKQCILAIDQIGALRNSDVCESAVSFLFSYQLTRTIRRRRIL